MKVSIVGTVGVPAQYGGFETLVENLLSYSSGAASYSVICSSKNYAQRPSRYKNARLIYLPLQPNGPMSVSYDLCGMLMSLRSDAILLLGVSAAVFVPLIKLLCKGKVIINIDGLEWTRPKWSPGVRLFLKLSEWFAVRFADEVIADNAVIASYVEKRYRKHAALIEYGGDHVRLPAHGAAKAMMKGPYAFTVCRIEPENNIELILSSFVPEPSMGLVVVGNWEASKYGRLLKKRYKGCSGILLLDPIYDMQKLNALRMNASVYIHGHSAGGTNPSLVEAMALGLTIAAYGVKYNRETTEGKCLYFLNSQELRHIITSVNDEQKRRVGDDMIRIADRRYRWSIIASKYEALFL